MPNMLKPRARKPNVCMRCGYTKVVIEHRSDIVDFKGLTLEVDGLAQTVCQKCGHCWTTEGQEIDNLGLLRSAFAIQRDEIRTKEGLLTAEQINFVLAQLNLTKADAALYFGGGPNAFHKYASGEVLQSFAMDRLLRLALAFGQHALDYLRQGRSAPLYLYSGGFLVTASAPSSVSTVTIPAISSKDINNVYSVGKTTGPGQYSRATS